jgi:hypothetical protein
MKPGVLTQDPDVRANIRGHPGLLWKVQRGRE